MTRCLNCGSERQGDECPSCGLNSSIAELVFRPRFLKRTAVFLAGSLLFPYVSQIYPPLDLDWMLVFFGVIFFIGLTVAVFLDRGARKRQDIEVLKRIYAGFIPLPWILAATLFLNGKLDSPKKVVLLPDHGAKPLQHARNGARQPPPFRAFLGARSKSRASRRRCG